MLGTPAIRCRGRSRRSACLILRSPRSGRLEGWPATRHRLVPSFETALRASSGRGLLFTPHRDRGRAAHHRPAVLLDIDQREATRVLAALPGGAEPVLRELP